MPLSTSIDVLAEARRSGYAVPAFAAYTLESLTSVIQAAETQNSPVIIQTTEATLKFAGLQSFADAVKSVASRVQIPVILHLDHGSSLDLVVQCIRAGYTSVMIDASGYPLEENIRRVERVVEVAHAVGVGVEAEIGHIAGADDDDTSADSYTDPSVAEEFVKRTHIDSVAVSIGSTHGFYRNTPTLDLERLQDIARRIDIPIVLHGASGIPNVMVQESIARGISKVNIATELKVAMADALKEAFKATPDLIDPRSYLTAVKNAVRNKAEEIIQMVGSHGRG